MEESFDCAQIGWVSAQAKAASATHQRRSLESFTGNLLAISHGFFEEFFE
jgi:hypothetical protein